MCCERRTGTKFKTNCPSVLLSRHFVYTRLRHEESYNSKRAEAKAARHALSSNWPGLISLALLRVTIGTGSADDAGFLTPAAPGTPPLTPTDVFAGAAEVGDVFLPRTGEEGSPMFLMKERIWLVFTGESVCSSMVVSLWWTNSPFSWVCLVSLLCALRHGNSLFLWMNLPPWIAVFSRNTDSIVCGDNKLEEQFQGYKTRFIAGNACSFWLLTIHICIFALMWHCNVMSRE